MPNEQFHEHNAGGPEPELPEPELPGLPPDARIAEALTHLREARMLIDQARVEVGRGGRGRYLANANTAAETAELWSLRALGQA